jgi:hypothetical protein
MTWAGANRQSGAQPAALATKDVERYVAIDRRAHRTPPKKG